MFKNTRCTHVCRWFTHSKKKTAESELTKRFCHKDMWSSTEMQRKRVIISTGLITENWKKNTNIEFTRSAFYRLQTEQLQVMYLLSIYDTGDFSVDCLLSQAFREMVDNYVQVRFSGLNYYMFLSMPVSVNVLLYAAMIHKLLANVQQLFMTSNTYYVWVGANRVILTCFNKQAVWYFTLRLSWFVWRLHRVVWSFL